MTETYYEVQREQEVRLNGHPTPVRMWLRVDFLPRFTARGVAIERMRGLEELVPRARERGVFRVVEIASTVVSP